MNREENNQIDLMREGGDLGEEEELARDALLWILKIDFPPLLTHTNGQKRCLDTQDHLPTIFLSINQEHSRHPQKNSYLWTPWLRLVQESCLLSSLETSSCPHNESIKFCVSLSHPNNQMDDIKHKDKDYNKDAANGWPNFKLYVYINTTS